MVAPCSARSDCVQSELHVVVGQMLCIFANCHVWLNVICRQRANYRQLYLPWALDTAKSLKPLMTVYWEKRWDQNLDDLQNELNIVPLESYKTGVK